MHTTFLPTLAYLSMILLGWLAQSVPVPTAWFPDKAASKPNPLLLTSLLFAIVWAPSGVLDGLL